MKDLQITGIFISKDTKLQSTARKISGGKLMILRCLCFCVCMAGLLQMAEEGFGLELQTRYVLTGIFLECFFLGICAMGKGRFGNIFRRICYGVISLAGAGIAIFRRERIISGYLAVENGIRGRLEDYYGINLAARVVPLQDEKGEWFIFVVFTIMILAFGNLVIQRGRAAMLALMTVLLFALELLCGCRFQGYGVYLAAESIFVLIAMEYRRGSRNQNVLYRAGLWASAVILILAIGCGLFLGPALYRYAKDWNQQLYEYIRQTTNRVSAAVRSQNGLFGDHTPTADGSLNNYPVDQDEKTDLKVTVDEKPEQNIYLRGFVGDTYEGTYWHRLDESEFRAAFPQENSAYEIQNILYRHMESFASAQREEISQSSIIVERLDPGGEYGYIPYGFEVPNDRNIKGDGCYSSAEKENLYKGYVNWRKWLGDGAMSEGESELEARYREYAADQYLKVPAEGLDRLKEYCARQDFSSVQQVIDFVVPTVKEGRVYSMDLQPVPEGQDFAEYFFFEQKKGYCIHYATTATLMFRLLGVPARYATGYVVSPEAFAENGETYVAEVPDTQAHAWVEVYRSGKGWFPLEVTPGYERGISPDGTGEMPQEQSPAESGIQPTPTEPAPEAGITAEPTPESDGLSAEPTPESDGSLVEPTPESGGNSAESMPKPDNSPDGAEQGTEGIQTPGVNGKGQSAVGKVIVVISRVLAVALAMLFFAGSVWIGILMNRKRVIKKRKAVFFQQNTKQGICQISYGLYQLLWDAGIREAGGRDTEYAAKMEEKLECVKNGEFVRFVEIVQQAAYGQEEMPRELCQECYEFYREIAEYLWQGMSKRKKFWWKYMKCYEIS